MIQKNEGTIRAKIKVTKEFEKLSDPEIDNIHRNAEIFASTLRRAYGYDQSKSGKSFSGSNMKKIISYLCF